MKQLLIQWNKGENGYIQYFTDGHGKGFPRLQHSKEIQEGKFQCWKCSLVGIRVSRSGDKSKIINSFELKILTERVGGMG